MMYSGRRFALLAPFASLLVPLAEARACPEELPPIWHPQRSWPAACEPDVPTDGFVLLEGDALEPRDPGGQGALEIVLQRTEAGTAIETVPGTISYPDATSALFRADRPLAPNADYLVSARRSGAGEERPSFTTAFTTGARTLRPIAFDAPSAQLEVVEARADAGERQDESEGFVCTRDRCGERHCTATDDGEPAKLVRIAVPPIGGGIEQKPYAVSAELVASLSAGQAPLVATSDVAVTQAGRRSFLVIALPASLANASATEGAQGCVTVTAEDVAGHSATSEPICLALGDTADAPTPADVPGAEQMDPSAARPGDHGEEAPEELAYAQSVGAASATGDDAHAEAGCAVGAAADTRGLAWLGILLAWLRARPRRRSQI